MRSSFVATLVVAILVTGSAFAEPTAAEIAVARKLFQKATTHEKAEEWAEAEAALREALAIKETPGLRYHLAHVQEQQGKLVEALVDYDRAAELIANGTKAPDVDELLGPAREAVQAATPTITVRVPSDVEGATLSVDGRKLSPQLLGEEIPLNPGSHQLSIAAPGHEPFEMELTLARGERRTLTAELISSEPAEPAQPGAQAPPDPGPAPKSRPSFGAREWVLIGEGAVGLAGLGVGIAFTLEKNDAQDRRSRARARIEELAPDDNAACPGSGVLQGPCDDLAGAVRDADDAQTRATIGFVIGGVGAAATVATLLFWKRSPSESTSAQPVVLPTRGGFVSGFSGHF